MSEFRMGRHHEAILKILGAGVGGGFTTGDIGQQLERQLAGYHFMNGHQRAGATLSWLTDLERAGYVKRMDDEKPIVWCRRVDQQPDSPAPTHGGQKEDKG